MRVVGSLGGELQSVDLVKEPDQFSEFLVAEQLLEPDIDRQLLGRLGPAGAAELDG